MDTRAVQFAMVMAYSSLAARMSILPTMLSLLLQGARQGKCSLSPTNSTFSDYLCRNGINSGPEGYIKSTRVIIANNTVTGDWDYAITTEGKHKTQRHVILNFLCRWYPLSNFA